MQRRQRDSIAQESVNHIANGVAVLPQTTDSEHAVYSLRDMVASRKVEVRAYLRSPLHLRHSV